MNSYIGKICPFCKAEIKEGDAVKVCPTCDIPHHEGCWEENKGCTTFGCPEPQQESQQEPQHTNAAYVCKNCGTPLEEGQAFCPRCGTLKVEEKKNICSQCGTELQDGQAFCPRCGQRVGLVVDQNTNAAISRFNAGVEKKNKKSKLLPIVAGTVVVIAILVGTLVSHTLEAKKAEEAKKDYIANTKEFLELTYTAGVNLEDIADTIQEYWYENIWHDKHGYDINDAILYAMVDKSEEISQAESYDEQLQSLYSKIKSVSTEIAEEDADEIKELCDAVKELYNVYTDFYSLATDPSGSYNSYSDDNSETTDEFLSSYRALENLLQ